MWADASVAWPQIDLDGGVNQRRRWPSACLSKAVSDRFIHPRRSASGVVLRRQRTPAIAREWLSVNAST
jgi:hypothetical protein